MSETVPSDHSFCGTVYTCTCDTAQQKRNLRDLEKDEKELEMPLIR